MCSVVDLRRDKNLYQLINDGNDVDKHMYVMYFLQSYKYMYLYLYCTVHTCICTIVHVHVHVQYTLYVNKNSPHSNSNYLTCSSSTVSIVQ